MGAFYTLGSEALLRTKVQQSKTCSVLPWALCWNELVLRGDTGMYRCQESLPKSLYTRIRGQPGFGGENRTPLGFGRSLYDADGPSARGCMHLKSLRGLELQLKLSKMYNFFLVRLAVNEKRKS